MRLPVGLVESPRSVAPIRAVRHAASGAVPDPSACRTLPQNAILTGAGLSPLTWNFLEFFEPQVDVVGDVADGAAKLQPVGACAALSKVGHLLSVMPRKSAALVALNVGRFSGSGSIRGKRFAWPTESGSRPGLRRSSRCRHRYRDCRSDERASVRNLTDRRVLKSGLSDRTCRPGSSDRWDRGSSCGT